MDFFNNHTKLFRAALTLFLFLTLIIAILPAYNNQENNAPLPDVLPLSTDAKAGKLVFISNGCVACHTQQVRNVDMDKVFGSRPSIAADYAANKRIDIWRNTATLMGTERTGPDLINIGNRQPSEAWHLLHLYQPRAVVEASIMPAYPWLFEEKYSVDTTEIEVNIPQKFKKNPKTKVVATKEALQLVAYLQSLRQADLPTGIEPTAFLYKKETKKNETEMVGKLPDGAQLYTQNCQSCHQANGEGLKGAFPALKGSPIVMGNDIELFVNIIMKGYDPRPEYAAMPAVGLNSELTAEDVTAIMNHERSSWGNNAKPLSVEEVKKIYDFIKQTTNQ